MCIYISFSSEHLQKEILFIFMMSDSDGQRIKDKFLLEPEKRKWNPKEKSFYNNLIYRH